MSRARQARRRAEREALAAFRGVMVSWCAGETEIPNARHVCIEKLGTMMGATRIGGFSWYSKQGNAALQTLASLTENATPELAEHYARVGVLVQDHGGWVVVVSALQAPPAEENAS